MKEFIEFLLKQFVSKPESLSVEEINNNGSIQINISVDSADMGLVIGKEGRTIKSIRNLARAKAIRDNVKVNIDVLEDTNITE